MDRKMMVQLVNQARQNDKKAFEQLVIEHEQSLYKTAMYYLSNDQDAADALQETIMKAWTKLDTLKEDQYFSTWLTQILINRCKTMLRQRASEEPADLSDSGYQKPVQQNEYEEAEWLQTFRMLKEREQRVLVLYYLQRYNTREISEILEITESASRSLLHQAKKHLREILKG